MTSSLTTTATAVGVVAGAGLAVTTLIVTVGRPLRRLGRWLDEFREDWYGQPARPGRAAIPGIPERLARIEGELRSNGGSTLRDAINRLETRFEDHLRTHQPPPGGST